MMFIKPRIDECEKGPHFGLGEFDAFFEQPPGGHGCTLEPSPIVDSPWPFGMILGPSWVPRDVFLHGSPLGSGTWYWFSSPVKIHVFVAGGRVIDSHVCQFSFPLYASPIFPYVTTKHPDTLTPNGRKAFTPNPKHSDTLTPDLAAACFPAPIYPDTPAPYCPEKRGSENPVSGCGVLYRD